MSVKVFREICCSIPHPDFTDVLTNGKRSVVHT